MKTLASLFVSSVFTFYASAQVQIVDSGATGDQVNLSGTYTQSFDSLASTGSGVFPMTLSGWRSGDYGINNTGGGSASFGTDGSSDRALGSGGTGTWALSFANLTSSVISSVSISYDGEQWKRGSNNPQVSDRMSFSYKIFSSGAGTISGVVGWTVVPELYFDSPNFTMISGSLLDGNYPENRMVIMYSLTGIVLAPGQELWVRWSTGENVYNDHALATDNVQVSFTAIPEPASSALLIGLCGLVMVSQRNRRRGLL